MTCLMRWRSNAILRSSAAVAAPPKALLAATWVVSRYRLHRDGVGMVEKPPRVSCQMYWFAARQALSEPGAVELVSRHASGFGPATPLPLTTYSRSPPRLVTTAFGYQPVGMRPSTRDGRAPRSPQAAAPSATTATELVPPLVT